MNTQAKELNLPVSVLTKKQVKIREKDIMYYDEKCRLIVEIRHDDGCGNGHNSFAITGEVRSYDKRLRDRTITCGCIHEIIVEHFPGLAPYIKWHLCSSDGPIHYPGNALYHAGDRDCWHKRKGEPSYYGYAVKFGSFPMTFKINGKFWTWLKSLENYDLEIMSVEHKREPQTFGSKFTFLPFASDTWHECPFDTEQEATEFLLALQQHDPEFIQIPTSWSKGKDPDLEAARYSAIWPEATLEQLQDKDQLMARLPALMEEFKAAVESLGLVY